ncbi:hypothetical protein Slin14017_G108670 [Septoria linicola]|nr:hypothetical protein Slin14017_G108670 [Septoria linicola]
MADTQPAQLFGAHFFDYGLPHLPQDDPSFPPVDDNYWPIDMTQLTGFDVGLWPGNMTSEASQIMTAKSPGQQSHQTAGGSESLTPDDASGHNMTPSSTDFSPYIADFDDPESDIASGSPESDRSIEGDYVHISSPNRPRGHSQAVHQNAPRSSSRPAPLAQTFMPAHDVHQTLLQPSQAMPSETWASFGSSSGASMSDLTATTYDNNFPIAGDFPLYDSAFLANVGRFDIASHPQSHAHPAPAQYQEYPSLPFRGHDGDIPMLRNDVYLHPQSLAGMQHMQNANTYAPQAQLQQANINVASQASGAHQLHAPQIYTNDDESTRRVQPVRVPQLVTLPITTIPRSKPVAQAQSSQKLKAPTAVARVQGPARPRVQVRKAPLSSGGTSPTGSSRSAESAHHQGIDVHGSYPVIAAADPSRQQLGTARVSQADKISKGGRKKGGHLPDQSRQRSSAMRKVGACWRCVMQRDPCDAPDGGCCSRCNMRSARGQAYFFDCDRSKLPEFVVEFLPASLLHEHQKQSIETFVSREVGRWHTDNPIDVYLSSGYGPPLLWRLYEFTPHSNDFLWQLQVTQDPSSRRSITTHKYSPPYGLMRIDSVDDRNYESYLEDLLHPHWLKELGESAYAEENLVDDQQFQCKVLDLLCKLYVSTLDATLKPLLADILRMIIITYIMGHTMTITEDTVYTVVNNLQHSPKPPATQKHTSPRLANRQFKFFFHLVRNRIYEKILKWQQHTLHTAGKKQETWLHAFCVTLGFAMVLEEVQRTIMCQADAKICRQGVSQQAAYQEAQTHCDNIDKRFRLLTGLFQCKYRDRKWTDRGSFGNGTPEFRDPIACTFLFYLRNLVEERQTHLQERAEVQFSIENQCYYTTRLTAKFLLPFLNLPAS